MNDNDRNRSEFERIDDVDNSDNNSIDLTEERFKLFMPKESRSMYNSENSTETSVSKLGNSKTDGESQRKSAYAAVFDWVDSIVASVIVVVVLFTFVFRVVGIVGNSMNDTLYNGDRVIISNVGYTPKQGDIVVVSRNVSNNKANETSENEPIIKRVIATEGQTVDIKYDDDGKGYVYVDGHQFGNGSYIKELINKNVVIPEAISFPVTVKEGCIFVLGDNRNNSLDSRSSMIGNMGMIDTRYVLGKALFRVYPFNKIGSLTYHE